MQLSQEVMSHVAALLQERHGFCTKGELDRSIADLQKRAFARLKEKPGSDFSMTRVLRGLAAEQGRVINRDTATDDLEYAKRALATGTQPGSYLIPQIQANEIISILTVGGIARQSGVRIWDMAGTQKLSIPASTAFPTVEFIGQNSSQNASDPNLSQVNFDLKTRRALVVVPNELLRSSLPSYDVFLTELLGQAFAEHEDTIFFAATAASNGPTPFYATANTTVINTGGSANGGNLAYVDILGMLKSAASAKLTGNLAFYMSPRSMYSRLLGLLDLQSRPIIVSDPTAAAPFRLFGWPVYVSPAIPENLSNGSGTNQSYILLTNPSRCLHIAQSSEIQVGVSTERYFELNQVGVRICQGLDLAASPASGCVVLKGVN